MHAVWEKPELSKKFLNLSAILIRNMWCDFVRIYQSAQQVTVIDRSGLLVTYLCYLLINQSSRLKQVTLFSSQEVLEKKEKKGSSNLLALSYYQITRKH